MLKKRPLDEIKECLLREDKTESDINMLFKENQALRQIPPNQRGDVRSKQFCMAMSLHVFTPLEVILTDSVKKPDLFLILEGKAFLRNKAKEEITYEAYDIFGYTSPFDNKKWLPARVTARETITLISIPRIPLKKAMEKVKKAQDNYKLIEFLVKTVPGVRQLGQAGKEKVLNNFERCKFKTGDVLLREGEKARHAFIIEEGECKIIGSQNPLKRPGSAPPRGLISKTTSCYNLGLAMSGEWVGEDSILTSKLMEFSVIAGSHVTALRITREKFTENLTKDTQNLLKDSFGKKKHWRDIRRNNISLAISENVIDEKGMKEVLSYKDIEKNYPKASKNAIVNLRQQEFEKIEFYDKAEGLKDEVQESFSKTMKISRSRPQTGKNRPMSAATDKKLGLGGNVDSKHFLFSQVQSKGHRYSNSMNEPVQSGVEKIQLYSAFTLGYTLVPTMVRRPISASVRNSQVFVAPNVVKNEKAQSRSINSSTVTFGQSIRNGRPESPNPVEVWAKKQGVDLKKYS